MIKNCPKCGTEFDDFSKWGPKKFCSRKCANSKVITEEQKSKISKKLVGRPSPNKGKKLGPRTEEVKEKISKTLINNFLESKGTFEERRAKGKYKRKAWTSAYEAKKKKAIIESSNLDLIKEIYKHCPDGYEVDHIVAISVGGLHHQDNLQYLPSLENKKKGSRKDYDTSLAIHWQDILAPTELERQ